MRSNVWKMSSTKIDIQYDVTLAFIISDIILGIYLSILGDDIFRTLEYITLYTTLVYIIDTNFVHVNTINIYTRLQALVLTFKYKFLSKSRDARKVIKLLFNKKL